MTFNKRRNILYLEQKTYTCTFEESKEKIVLELDEGKVFTTFQKGNQYEKVEKNYGIRFICDDDCITYSMRKFREQKRVKEIWGF